MTRNQIKAMFLLFISINGSHLSDDSLWKIISFCVTNSELSEGHVMFMVAAAFKLSANQLEMLENTLDVNGQVVGTFGNL